MDASKAAAGAPSETANIHLQVLGTDITVSIALPQGQPTVRALLPIARTLTQATSRVALELATSQGSRVSCKAGCSACCRQLVVISLVEAQALADAVSAMPASRQQEIRRRFAEAIHRLESAGMLDADEAKGDRPLLDQDSGAAPPSVPALARRYFQLQIPCPFLEDESCSVYSERPLVCREYVVTSPAENCARLYEAPVVPVPVPVHMGDALAHTAHKVARAPLKMIPLVYALEWSQAHPGALERTADGLEMVQTLMAQLDQNFASAYSERADGALS